MEKEEFVNRWVVTFLATWTANNYDDACVMGQQERLNDPPIEDAEFLAEKQWLKFKAT